MKKIKAIIMASVLLIASSAFAQDLSSWLHSTTDFLYAQPLSYLQPDQTTTFTFLSNTNYYGLSYWVFSVDSFDPFNVIFSDYVNVGDSFTLDRNQGVGFTFHENFNNYIHSGWDQTWRQFKIAYLNGNDFEIYFDYMGRDLGKSVVSVEGASIRNIGMPLPLPAVTGVLMSLTSGAVFLRRRKNA